MKPDDDRFNIYLNYVRAGGTLIIINSNNNFSSSFAQLFSLKSNDAKTEEFTSIDGKKNQNHLVNVTGLVKRFELQPSSDVNIIATYKNKNNQTIAPFAIEKTFPNQGKIVFINAGGYYNAISALPVRNFLSLGNFSEMLGFKKDASKLVSTSSQDKATSNGFIRNMNLSGNITLNSSSLLLADRTSYPYPVNAWHVDIYNKTNSPPITLNNVSLKNLNAIGRYNASINFMGKIELPDSMSDRSYIGLSIPTDFNMTLSLYPQGLSNIEMVTENGTSTNSIKVTGESKIEFHKIRAYAPLKYIPVLLKNPEIKINGETSISNGLQKGLLTKKGSLNTGTPLEINGQLNAKFGFVDNYKQFIRNETLINYITYLQSVTTNNTLHEHKQPLILLSDFGSILRDRELDMALQNALTSPSNIIFALVLSIVTIIAVKIIWKKKKI
jgi:hypothetical protein